MNNPSANLTNIKCNFNNNMPQFIYKFKLLFFLSLDQRVAEKKNNQICSLSVTQSQSLKQSAEKGANVTHVFLWDNMGLKKSVISQPQHVSIEAKGPHQHNKPPENKQTNNFEAKLQSP